MPPATRASFALSLAILGVVAWGCSGSDGSGPAAPIPTVTEILPLAGPVDGGTDITITGTNFAAEAWVSLGGIPATNIHVIDPAHITAVTGPHAAGSADVVVFTHSVNASLAAGFTYLPPMTMTGIAPAIGPTHGGTAVTISGSNFESGATVTIGGKQATNIQVINALHILAVTPDHDAGLADVVVTSTAGTVTLSRGFEYLASIDALETALSSRYFEVFGERILQPAIHDNSSCGGAQVTTTAYLNKSGTAATLMFLYTSIDGSTVTRHSSGTVVKPAGTFRVLVLLVGYPQTVGANALQLWGVAQTAINEDHAGFARARGYPAAIVNFLNTNVVIDASQVADPRTLSGVSTPLAAQGISVEDYDFVVSVNPDPSRSEGGFASVGRTPAFIYMGNFIARQVALTAADFNAIAGAVYHHEVVHHWGWPGTHDWERCTRYPSWAFNFRVPPVLLGWEDVDGDGVPEILDPTPYGRLAAPPS